MRLPAGTLIGRYRVDAYVNEGGMQQVYRATDMLLGREVALKTPKNDGGERRFDRSARASARICHANVARTLDYFEEGGRYFLVEEFIQGLDLGAILKRSRRLDPYLAAQVLHGLARGIAAVHRVNIVHRDLKPGNVMAPGGFAVAGVKITDFGVARLAEAEIDAGVAGGLLSITGSKTLIGHLPYLAPEILRRRKTVDPRADIWAVGALAFHFLVDSPPFGDELADVVPRILDASVPPLPEDIDNHPQFGGLSREIYSIITACLQRDPEVRPTAEQLVWLCDRLCYPVQERERGVVTGYPGGTYGFAESPQGTVFFHVESIVGPWRPRIGGEIWFARHKGEPRDRAHPVVPLMEETA